MSIENKSSAFDVFREAKSETARSRLNESQAREQFTEELESADGKLVSFKGRPLWHVYISCSPSGKRARTAIPCYSLLDEEMKPREYQGATVLGVSKGEVHVTYPGWERNYEIVPIDSITDFAWVEAEAASI